MKKTILAISAMCAAAACFGACNSSCGSNAAELDKYETLNAKLNLNYSRIVITVTDTFDADASLISTYTVSRSDDGVKVSYSIERFAEISLESPSNEFKTTVTGEAVFRDGALVSGDATIAASVPETGLTFKAEYFDGIASTDKTFKANVTNASGFTGSEITCTEMKVFVNFATRIDDITITYKSAYGASVECKYEYKS